MSINNITVDISNSFTSIINTALTTCSYTIINNNCIKITSSGNIAFNNTFLCNIVVVGGGGGGGGGRGNEFAIATYEKRQYQFGGGGGGGGGVLLVPFQIIRDNYTYPIVIGNGGTSSAVLRSTVYATGGNGGTSSIKMDDITFTAQGGGGGASYLVATWFTGTTIPIGYGTGLISLPNSYYGTSSGSGGGGSCYYSDGSYTGDNITPIVTNNFMDTIIYANNGGIGEKTPQYSAYRGGGGGGASSIGISGSISGNGGNGIDLTYHLNSNIGYLGGGGGGGHYNASPGIGGLGGGGNGGYYNGTNTTIWGIAGTANTGGGGGGGSGNSGTSSDIPTAGGGVGGSGVVIIKLISIFNTLTCTADQTINFNQNVYSKVLIVGGGGSGGTTALVSYWEGGGGGGAGGLGDGTIIFKANTNYNIIIGNGGNQRKKNTFSFGQNGSNTSIIGDTINEIAYGGGGGALFRHGNDGGCGGGGTAAYSIVGNGGDGLGGISSSTGNASICWFGNMGGNFKGTAVRYGGMGGGGAGSKGTSSFTYGGNSPDGTSGGLGYKWIYDDNYYAGGGGGGANNRIADAIGGSGTHGGGSGEYTSLTTFNSNATPNTGGGGGGGNGYNNSGDGGSGIVKIMYTILRFNFNLSFYRNLYGYSSNSVFKFSNLRYNNASLSNISLLGKYAKREMAGLSLYNPAISAKFIKSNGNNSNGIYNILCGSAPNFIYCLMEDKYAGGGWSMLMKSTRSTTFNFNSSYWESINTLNNNDISLTISDAKYNTFNYTKVLDLMVIWPSSEINNISNGGSISISDGWVWISSNVNLGKANVSSQPIELFKIKYGRELHSNNILFSGFNSNIWSTQTPSSKTLIGGRDYISTTGTANARYGFVFNENAANDFTSCDVSGGIGLYNTTNANGYSSGDYSRDAAVANTIGFNRQIGMFLYGR